MTKTIKKIEELIKEGIIISEKAIDLIGNHPQQKINEQKAEQKVSKMTAEEITTKLLKLISKPNKKIDKMTPEEIKITLLGMLGDKPFMDSVRNLEHKYIHWHKNIKKTMPNKIETTSLFMLDDVYTVDNSLNSGKVILETIKKETDKKIEKLEELGKNLNDGKLKKEKENNIVQKIIKKDSGREIIKIYISDDDGIYLNQNNKKLNYPIRSRSKRLKIIKNLKDGKKDGKILANILYKGDFSELSKEIGEINKKFKNRLKLKKELIINLNTGGYTLNDTFYKIKFVD